MTTTDQRVDQLGLVLVDILSELRWIHAAMGASGSVPSVEIDVDSKGVVKPHVKIYDLDADTANAKAQAIFDELVIKYTPAGALNGGKPG